MSRLEQYCPNCDTLQPIPLMTPSGEFTCEGCNVTLPRTKLVERRMFKHALSGAPVYPPVAVEIASATLYDATQATGSLVTPSFLVSPGDTIVVCIAHSGTDSSVDYVTVGADAVSGGTSSSGTALGQWGEIYLFTPTDMPSGTGVKTASVTFNGGVVKPTAAVMTVLRVTNLLAAPLDRQKAAKGTSVNATTTASLAMRAFGEIVIGITSYADSAPPLGPTGTWLNGYNRLSVRGTVVGSNPSDCSLDTAVFYPNGLVATTAAETLANSVNWVSCLVSLKHA